MESLEEACNSRYVGAGHGGAGLGVEGNTTTVEDKTRRPDCARVGSKNTHTWCSDIRLHAMGKVFVQLNNGIKRTASPTMRRRYKP